MTQGLLYRYFKTLTEIVRLAVMLYVRFLLSRRNVEDLPRKRGIKVGHETVRVRCHRFGPLFAAEIPGKRASSMKTRPQWRWHLGEVFVKINGVRHYLWRAIDHEGEVLESVVTKTRDRRATLKFLIKLMRWYGRREQIPTDRLRSYEATLLRELGAGAGSTRRVMRTTAPRTRTCRSGDENGRFYDSGR